MRALSAKQIELMLAQQPAPTPYDRDRGTCLDAVLDHISVDPDNQAVLEARVAQGVERYGVPLQSHNGRKALFDLIQERVDSVFYSMQCYEETEDPFYRTLAVRDLDALSYLYDRVKKEVKA